MLFVKYLYFKYLFCRSDFIISHLSAPMEQIPLCTGFVSRYTFSYEARIPAAKKVPAGTPADTPQMT